MWRRIYKRIYNKRIPYGILLLVGVVLLFIGLLIYHNNWYEMGDSITPLRLSSSYLRIPTYEGSGQAVHPDVVYFPEGWNGYRYWMAITPYPDSDDHFENPSILVSNNGISWQVPPGLDNPLDSDPYLASGGHNGDPDMIYDEDTGELWLYYEENGSGTTFLRRRRSRDGIHWSEEETLLDVPDSQLVSPAIVKLNSTYRMWYVDAGSEGCWSSKTVVKYRESQDGIHWSDAKGVEISQEGYHIWHLNVMYIPLKGEFWMLFSAYPDGSSCSDNVLFFARSKDGINWQTFKKIALDKPSEGSWNVYRSAFLYDPKTNLIKVWYSIREGKSWHIGFTQGNYSSFLNYLTSDQ